MCPVCNQPMPEVRVRRRAITCSKKCAREREYVDGYKVLNPGLPGVSSGTVGAIAELVVTVWLFRRGWSVFRAVSPACKCDLIAMRNGALLRVEVATAYLSKSGRRSWGKKNASYEYDTLAAVVGDSIEWFDREGNPAGEP